MTAPSSMVRISAVGVGAIERNDRQTGQRLEAASSTAPTLLNNPERAELLERLLGSDGALTVYGRELESIRQQAAALRLENRALLERVRKPGTHPASRRKVTQR